MKWNNLPFSTRLGALNFFILQWFFIRLGKIVEVQEVEINYVALMPGGKASVSMTPHKHVIRWTILKWIIPLTGWWSDFIYIKRK